MNYTEIREIYSRGDGGAVGTGGAGAAGTSYSGGSGGGVKEYSGRKVHCCFNIYKRPENGLNSKPDYKTDVIEVREVREVIKNQNPKRYKEFGDFQYDIAICAWGTIVTGKQIGRAHV